MKNKTMLITVILLAVLLLSVTASAYAGVDTGQAYCYGVDGTPIPCPEPGEALFGQDANYVTTQPSSQDNGDGTITDLNTGLMWQKTPADKLSWEDAMSGAASFNLGGYTDWRVPSIKELYSLMDFSGITGQTPENSTPYLDTAYFDFKYGDIASGERMIDAQYWSSTEYVSTTMHGNHTVFGVNFADGRIKGYGTYEPARGTSMMSFVRYVRGAEYGVNNFVDNSDGTITDQTSSLMWMQLDSGAFGVNGMFWADALSWCENMQFAGYDDWRLPDAKELQGIIDYTRSPATSNSAAIDPLFSTSTITDEGGAIDYPFFWTSTTHLDGINPGDRAVYISFGTAYGFMQNPVSGEYELLDVHGAGAQRSDLKAGDPSEHPYGWGPQGDVERIYNYARCVRGGSYQIFTGGDMDQVIVMARSQNANFQPPPNVQGQNPQPQNEQPQNGQGQPPQVANEQAPSQGQPPQEAIDACTGLSIAATGMCTSRSIINQ